MFLVSILFFFWLNYLPPEHDTVSHSFPEHGVAAPRVALLSHQASSASFTEILLLHQLQLTGNTLYAELSSSLC